MARGGTLQHELTEGATVPTWFGVGGPAAAFAEPRTPADLRALLAEHPDAVVLGEGANLLVDDCGVDRLVVTLSSEAFRNTTIDAASGRVTAAAGADLHRLITATTRAGLAGLERLSGIPATIGGATIMNAGGAYGELAEFVTRVHAIDRSGVERTLASSDIAFGYRTSGLSDLIITDVELQLEPQHDPMQLRERMKTILSSKRSSQPMGATSAGCVFKNPIVADGLGELAIEAGARVRARADARVGARIGAGLLIDRAGGKGLSVGDATVSQRHANFITTGKDARASHVIELISRVQSLVLDRFGVALEREVVIWPHDLGWAAAL